MLRFATLLAALVIVVTLGGCHGVLLAPHHGGPFAVHEQGPPSHAPAHGYRHKHHSGAEFRFDSQLGVYIVLGQAELYFHDGLFVRIHNGSWQVSASFDGPWKSKSTEWVPPGLRSKHHAKHQAKKPKGRGRGAAKPAW